MQSIVSPLKPPMQGPSVADLHIALALLGFPIAKAEQTARRYGVSTRKAVRDFQEACQITATGIVDAATASTLNNILAELVVQVYVTSKLQNGKPAAGAQLVVSYDVPGDDTWTSQPQIADREGTLAFELPVTALGSVDWSRASYSFSMNDRPLRVVEMTQPDPVEGGFAVAFTLAQGTIPWPPERDPNKWYVRGRVTTPYGEALMAQVSAAAISLQGAKPLGDARTSDTGRYEITYEWDGKCAPDIQVSANGEDELIAQSAIYFAVGKSIGIDLISGNEPYIGPTEFQGVEERILKCNGDFTIADIGAKQFEYLLGKTRLAKNKLSFYLTARRMQSLCDVPAAVFYGLFRAKLPATLQGLVLQPPKVLQNALNSSIQKNIVDRKYKNDFDSLLAGLRQMAVVGALNHNQQLGHAGVGDLLTLAEVPESAQEQLIKLYFEHGGDDAAFWQALEQDTQLAPYANQTKASLQLGALASYHLPTLQAFKTRLGTGRDD